MEKRVKFNFEVYFTNGGFLKGEDFRLDIVGDTITDEALAACLIEDLNLLMVGKTVILKKEILQENHRRQEKQQAKSTMLIDLSHTIEHGLITYKGLPAPVVCDYLSREDSRQFYEEGTEFQIGKIEMVANTGTYIDCPFHRFKDGKDLSEVALTSLADLDAIVVRVPYRQSKVITVGHLQDLSLRNRAVLLHTGWDENWNTPSYYENNPFLSEEAAEFLKDANVKLVGIDSHNIDDTTKNTRPAHTILLGAGILIVEHMTNLTALPDDKFTFTAVPPKFKGVGTFPVRAMAKVITS